MQPFVEMVSYPLFLNLFSLPRNQHIFVNYTSLPVFSVVVKKPHNGKATDFVLVLDIKEFGN